MSCQNCEFEAAVDAFHEATGIEARHTMGDVYSDKECPECGALAFPKDEGKALNRYIVIHEHRHGASTYEFRSPDDPLEVQGDEYLDRVVKALDIDFEPELLETLCVYTLPPDEEMPIIRSKEAPAGAQTPPDAR